MSHAYEVKSPGSQSPKLTEKEPEINVRVNQLHGAMERLESFAGRLIAKLEPVSRESPSESGEAPEPLSASPLGRELQAMRGRADRLADRLLTATELLEI